MAIMAIKLVIVDDAPFIREVLRHIVEDSNIQIVGEAEDGDQAVEVVKSKRPEVVFMDIVMPNKSGIEATKEILKAFPTTKIIACSTVNQDHLVIKALEAGCCDFVAKPFKSEEVIAAIHKAVGIPGEDG